MLNLMRYARPYGLDVTQYTPQAHSHIVMHTFLQIQQSVTKTEFLVLICQEFLTCKSKTLSQKIVYNQKNEIFFITFA